MQTLRRLYLYTVAFVSLEVVLWGAIGLVRSFAAGRGATGGDNQLAEALSLLLVGVPVFLLHWWLAQRAALRAPAERSALLRAIFLYGVLLATLLPVANNALSLLDRLLAGAFGLDPTLAPLGGGQTLNDNLIAIALNALAAAYFYFAVLGADWSARPLGEEFAEIRRLYRYIWAVYTLGMAGIGLQRILEAALLWLGARAPGWLPLLTSGLALLLVGAPLCAYTWWVVQRSLDEPAERDALLRLGVLFALVVVSAVGGLFSSIITLQTMIQFALAQHFASQEMFVDLSAPLSVGVVFGLIWLYTRRSIQAEVQPAASLHTDRLRRLYRYLLSLFGLGASFIGLEMLLLALLDLALAELGLAWGDLLQEQVAAGIAFLLVGLPVWLVSWLPLDREATVEGESGDAARRSLIRRGYLYLVLFAGVMGVMFASGGLIYQLLSAMLGEPSDNRLLTALQLLTTLLLFALLLAYHGWELRRDNRQIERLLSRRRAQYPVLVLAPEDAEFAERLVVALEREVPGLPVAVHPIEQGAPDETFSAAKAVILPGELLTKPPEALRLWLQAFDGLRLILPTRAEGWVWLSAGGQSLTAQARRAARLIRRLAEGED